jgi:hypothetical protein
MPGFPGMWPRSVGTASSRRCRCCRSIRTSRVAQEAGAKTVLVASAVGAVKGTGTYLEAIDYNVKALAQGLQ